MGSPKDEPRRDGNQEQEVRVTLTRGYWLGKYEVTQAEYEKLMGKNPSRFAKGGGGEAVVQGLETSRFPVESVSWNEAMAFCQKLTEQEHQAGRLPSDWKYTLPSEAQWEYSCRAGTTTATGFGDTLSSTQANFRGSSPYNGAKMGPILKRPTKVGSYRANVWGLCDMHGNVWEWCRDWHNFQLPGGKDPEASTMATYRVIRGGGWNGLGNNCRSAFRFSLLPGDGGGTFGFRLAAVQSRE